MARINHITTALAVSISALACSMPASAQMSADEIAQLPPEYQAGPAQEQISETTTTADGVETVIRTRRIERPASTDAYYPADMQPYPQGYAPSSAATVVERDAWIEECERRTNGRDENEKRGIIGSLLGAVAGGIIGNRVAGAGDRLGGTLIGAGTGGLGGLLLGSLIGGGKKGERYDCSAALDSYLSQYGHGQPRFASRMIPAPMVQAPAYAYSAPAYAYPAYAPTYSYSYAPPQQIVYVPIRYEQQQRVIVRETVREETYEVPGAARQIDAPPPKPVKLIKQPAPVQQAPRPVKMIKQ